MSKDIGRVGVAETGSREPSPAVSAASGFDPAREIYILEQALEEIAEWYTPDGMGTANELAGIAVDALDDLRELRKRGPKASPKTPPEVNP